MLLELTATEQNALQAIRDDCEREYMRIGREIAKRESAHECSEVIKNLRREQLATVQKSHEEVEAYLEKVGRERFQPIKEKGPEAILAHARAQADPLLADIHRLTRHQTGNLTPAALDNMGVGSVTEDGELILKANYAFGMMRDELHIHIQALAGDPEALQELLEVILETIENSPLTDDGEITAEKSPAALIMYRQGKLADLATFEIMNDKTNAQLIRDGDIFKQQTDGQLMLRWAIEQDPKGQESVPTLIALTYTGSDVRTSRRMSAYDQQVYEAVATRFYYWKKENPDSPFYITPKEVWRTMNGKQSWDERARPSETQVKRICESIERMALTRVYMDIGAEIQRYKLMAQDERLVGGEFTDYLLNCTSVKFYSNKGNELHGYRINMEPILFTYNKMKNHLLSVPFEMLDTTLYAVDVENVTEFKRYLVQQIQLMKNAEDSPQKSRFKRSNVILLETIYRETGIEPPEERAQKTAFTSEGAKATYIRKARQADRKKIEGILEAWIAKGWIKGFTVLNANNEPVKERQAAKAYRIQL